MLPQVFKRSFAVFLLFFCNFYNFRKIPTFRQDVTECLMPMSLVTFRNKCQQLRAFFLSDYKCNNLQDSLNW